MTDNRLSAMLEGDPVEADRQSDLQRLRELKNNSAAVRNRGADSEHEKEVAVQTARELGWRGTPSRRRSNRRAKEPVQVLYVRVPVSVHTGYLRWCDDNNLTQAEGFTELCALLPEGYRPADAMKAE